MPNKYSLRETTKKDFPFFKELHHLLFREHIEQIWGWDQDDQNLRAREAFENDDGDRFLMKKLLEEAP
ncbi:MAG: hypothetical protein H6861_04425 [Rhodospirillales bacterium]|nr:hypothetical protein [Rhodospirillales bacterium]